MGKLERIHTVTDTVTGEIIAEHRNVINIRPMDDEPAYVKLYIEDIGRMFQLKHGHQEILIYVASSVDYQGIVSLTIGRKARIAATAKCSVKSVDNAIGEYVKAGILERIGRGEYKLDPFLFAKGKWKDILERRASFKSTHYYTPKGRHVVTEIIGQGEETQVVPQFPIEGNE